MAAATNIEPARAPAPRPRPQPAKILVVDDRPDDLSILAGLLADPGHEVVAARSGEEALRRVLEADFAVILLDVVMPRMDGFEVARLIKQRERSRLTPILFLTAAHQEAGSIYRAYSAGAVDYLVKPLDEMVVRAKVSIFVELFRKDQRIREQAEELVEAGRRERELQLAEVRLLSEKRYRSLVETIPASVWTAERDGEVTYCNHRWFERTGLRLEDTRGSGWLDAVHPDDAARTRAAWREAVTRGKPIICDLRLRRPDGGFLWHLFHAVPEVNARGQARGWLAMFAECEELKRAVEARDEFMSIASHELRTPLTTMLLQLDMLETSLASAGAEERVRARASSVKRQAVRLDGLISNLLDVSRIGSGRLELAREDLDLYEVTQQCVERLGALAASAGSQLLISGGPGVRGRWDRMRVEQVVINLLSNAVKYGQGKPVEVMVESAGASALLRVRDQGIGIAPDQQPQLFQRFHRAVSSKHYSGLGIGLYITHQIVEAHGGTIDVKSQLGVGSMFSVALPIVAPESASGRAEGDA